VQAGERGAIAPASCGAEEKRISLADAVPIAQASCGGRDAVLYGYGGGPLPVGALASAKLERM
jgi:hypothetical protein